MVERAPPSAQIVRFACIGSIRCRGAAGAFATGLAASLAPALPGGTLPVAGTAVQFPDPERAGEVILAHRSPTETLVLCTACAAFRRLEAYAAGRDDGCIVELTGGIVVVALTGGGSGALLARLGCSLVDTPAPGTALSVRLAEVPVTSIGRPSDTLLLVEAVYAPHLLAWIGATLADADATATGALG